MLLISLPNLELRAAQAAKVYINGSTAFFRLGLLFSMHPDSQNAPFQVQPHPMLLKTSAYKWYGKHHPD
jgi:hypothetical protein